MDSTQVLLFCIVFYTTLCLVLGILACIYLCAKSCLEIPHAHQQCCGQARVTVNPDDSISVAVPIMI